MKNDAVLPAAASSPPTAAEGPLYLQLYHRLRAAIQDGTYPVHGNFPTEAQLCERHGLSRHTVREATRKLAQEGLISKQAGAGSVVRATQPTTPYVSTVGSLQGVMDYNNTTRLQVLGSHRKEASAELAAALDCAQGSVWIELVAMRHPVGQDNPMSYSCIYLRPAFAEIIAHLHGDHPSVYTLLQQLFGVQVDGIRQRIEATSMPPAAIELLKLPAQSPALHVQRCYYDAPQSLLAASLNWYIPARFRMETAWRRQEGGMPPPAAAD